VALRKVLEGPLLRKLGEAKQYLQLIGEEEVSLQDTLFEEWVNVTEYLLWLAFGDLSPHVRSFRSLRRLCMERDLLLRRFATCVGRAQRELREQGMPNPQVELQVGQEKLPDYARNREWERRQRQERFGWQVFWLWHLFDRFQL
jgi:hypothetical protein